MPIIKVERIDSFSSEDSKHPTENLLKSDVSKKWKCKNSGEPSATVTLVLEKKSIISGIDIGNENSAFIEVLARDSQNSGMDFEVLLTASSFMSPMESRNGTNTNRVRLFMNDQLLNSASKKAYDLIKLVCTQPFNKHVQYGLSFFTLHAPEIKVDNPITPKLGRALIKLVEPDDPISVGSLFARRHEKSPALTGAAAIRDASSSLTLQSNANKPKLFGASSKVDKTQTQNEIKKKNTFVVSENVNKQKNGKKDRPTTKASAQDNRSPSAESKNKIKLQSQEDNRSNSKLEHKPKRQTNNNNKATPPLKKAKVEITTKSTLKKPFNKLLNGVVIVISGYQNPHRGNIRSKALDMGAKYKPDWDVSCTHLICAFQNTPKYQQVAGKGFIVRKEWIEDCHANRRRLPWRRYALDKKEKDKEESEEEILEEVLDSRPQQDSDSDVETWIAAGQDSDSDTEDEIQRVQAWQESIKNGDDDPYGGDTDVDDENSLIEEQRDATSNLSLPHLLDIFDKKLFYLNSNITIEKQKQLLRYIVAYKGKISSVLDDHVDYVLSKNDHTIQKLKAEYPDVVFITPEWVWKCHNSEKLLSTTNYLIE